jgi:hypothetical protein
MICLRRIWIIDGCLANITGYASGRYHALVVRNYGFALLFDTTDTLDTLALKPISIYIRICHRNATFSQGLCSVFLCLCIWWYIYVRSDPYNCLSLDVLFVTPCTLLARLWAHILTFLLI